LAARISDKDSRRRKVGSPPLLLLLAAIFVDGDDLM
jgi:hypothetical protein